MYFLVRGNQVEQPFQIAGESSGIGFGESLGGGGASAGGNLYISLSRLQEALDSNALEYDLVDETFSVEYEHSLPVLIDFESETIEPIELFGPLIGAEYSQDRNQLLLAVRGAVARVATDDGQCLNVREEPGLEAGIVRCFANGVLLRDLGITRDEGGISWLQVGTPTDGIGWASTEFMER